MGFTKSSQLKFVRNLGRIPRTQIAVLKNISLGTHPPQGTYSDIYVMLVDYNDSKNNNSNNNKKIKRKKKIIKNVIIMITAQ